MEKEEEEDESWLRKAIRHHQAFSCTHLGCLVGRQNKGKAPKKSQKLIGKIREHDSIQDFSLAIHLVAFLDLKRGWSW